MPKLITRKTNKKAEPCNFDEVSLNEFEIQQVPFEELKKRCIRYKDYLAALQPPQDKIMIRAASFTVDSVLQMLQQSPETAFIRVYYGIETDGRHLFFMAPVAEAGTNSGATASISTVKIYSTISGENASEEDLIYVDECCACPPVRNCPGDELLDENP